MAVNVTIANTPEVAPQDTGVDVGITDPPRSRLQSPIPIFMK